jgi:hypothetical protein
MNLKYILEQVESSSGMNSPELNSKSRELLIKFINKAAQEIYKEIDLPRVLKEAYINVTNSTRVTLPTFVGELRAVRNPKGKMDLTDLRPRYALADWHNEWNKFRIVGETAINQEILNTSPLSVETSNADDDLIITLVGETDTSNRATDNIQMTEAEVLGTKNFNNITSISKNKITEDVVKIYDAENNELAVIYADQFTSRYLVVDISKYPAMQCCDGESFTAEILFKPRLGSLFFDQDTFPLQGYEDLLILRTKQLIAEENPGEEQRAILMYNKSQEIIKQEIQDKTDHVVKRLAPTRNRMFGLFPKWRC